MAPRISGPTIGVHAVTDIRGIPHDAIRVKVRQRSDDIGSVYVLRPSGIEEYFLLYDHVTDKFYINQHYRVGSNTRL